MLSNVRSLLLFAMVARSAANAADIRERIRLTHPPGAAVSQTQADELTLTLTEIQVRPIQNWIRTVGSIDPSGKKLTAYLSTAEATSIVVGQRARVFSADSKSSMYQARITRVAPQADRTLIEATLSGIGHDLSASYLLEIVVDYGEYLSVPNEAIIEEGDKQVVYVQTSDGSYQPHEISTRLQGERYTQVLDGVTVGQQVVTTGSFFIDAEYKMKGGN